MKALITLIKLSKRTLDELRRKMTVLENEKAQLLLAREALKAQLAQEMQLATQSMNMTRYFADFAKRVDKREEEIFVEIAKIDREIEGLRVEITEAFGDLKRYELALENKKKEQREKQNRLETDMLDEIAGQQYVRRQREENT